MDFIKNKPYMKSCDTKGAKPEDKILSPDEIESLKAEVRKHMTMKKTGTITSMGMRCLLQSKPMSELENCAPSSGRISQKAVSTSTHSNLIKVLKVGRNITSCLTPKTRSTHPRDEGTASTQMQGTPQRLSIFLKKESLKRLNYQAF